MDQLREEMTEGRVLCGYKEAGKPEFPPSYRYDRGTTPIGTRVYSEEKMRVPSWCDRVLYKTRPCVPIKAYEYNCCDAVDTR